MSENFETDDSTLLNEFRETRNEAAFTEIVRRHLPLVFQVALRRLGTAALAEEAAQHAFACLAAKVATVSRHPERLRAWLHRTAYFEASSLARKETRLSRLPIKPESHPDAMHRPEIYDRLDEVLNKLPELDRELVLRHCCGGEDYQRMAAAVGKSEAACQKRVERALVRLGQGLGGARTAGVVFAAFAATNMKSEAMPVAERVAAAALKYQSATSSAAGAFSGMKLGACAALVLAGGAAGWQKQVATVTPPAETRSMSARSRTAGLKTVSKNEDATFAPRPVSAPRTLDDVLETIQAGRLAPLIEFLPQATVPDLRAIMAEDDLGDVAEGLGTFGTAHGLAALRWVEIDPVNAFSYGVSRSDRLATRMLEHWMKMDPSAAAAAFRPLPLQTRQLLAGKMVAQNGSIADALALADPGIAWIVRESRILTLDPETRLQKSQQTVDLLQSSPPREEPVGPEAAKIRSAFYDIAMENPEAAIAQARLLPWPGLRIKVLSELSRYFNIPSTELPAGPLRADALARETENLMAADPEAALRKLREAAPGAERDAIYQVVAGNLAGSDPWKLLDLVSRLPGQLSGGRWNDLDRAFIYAGKDDPKRALGYLPAICARVATFGGPQEYAKEIVHGWLQKDPAAAITWTGGAGLVFGHEDLASSKIPQQVIVDLLSKDDPGVAGIARFALGNAFEESLTDGTVQELIRKVPQAETDRWLKYCATRRTWDGNYKAAMRVANEAPPLSRQSVILPAVVEAALRSDDGSGLKWLESLSSAEQAIILKCMEHHLNTDPPADADQLRETLHLHLKP